MSRFDYNLDLCPDNLHSYLCLPEYPKLHNIVSKTVLPKYMIPPTSMKYMIVLLMIFVIVILILMIFQNSKTYSQIILIVQEIKILYQQINYFYQN